MIAWLVSLLAHVRFRRVVSKEQLASAGMRSPLGAAGSIFGFVAIVASIACTWWVSQSSVAAKSAVIYLVVLTAAYWLVRSRGSNRGGMAAGEAENLERK
jgi:L-asparagine transporter-like permease